MLGARLAADAAATHEVIATGRATDVADARAVAAAFDAHRPALVINCAAYTAVDLAESQPDEAARLNTSATRVLSEACATHRVPFVHLSTDYVFDGAGTRPYREDDATTPQGVYARTKRDGELAALEHGALVVRTSWLYGPSHKNFVLTMLKLMSERDQLRVVNDQRGRPTSTATLSEALLALARAQATGVVHVADVVADPRGISWFDFACAIREGAVARGLPMKVAAVEPIPTSSYPTPAKRPAYSVLDTSRYTSLTGQTLKPWDARLADVLDIVAGR